MHFVFLLKMILDHLLIFFDAFFIFRNEFYKILHNFQFEMGFGGGKKKRWVLVDFGWFLWVSLEREVNQQKPH